MGKQKEPRLEALFCDWQGRSLRDSGLPGQSKFDQLFRVLFHHYAPTVGGAATLDMAAVSNGFIIVVVVGQITQVAYQGASVVVSEGPHHSTGYRVSVGPDKLSQGLGLLFVHCDVAASAAVLFLESVVYVYGGRFFVVFGLDFIFDSSCEDGAVVGPSAFFLSFYFSYYDVSFSLSEVVQISKSAGFLALTCYQKRRRRRCFFRRRSSRRSALRWAITRSSLGLV